MAPQWFSTVAAADECGSLQVSGYSALRTLGPIELRVAVSPKKERTEEVGGAGLVRIMDLDKKTTILLNPKTKSALIAPPAPKPPDPPVQKGAEKYVDREPATDGQITVSMGLKTPKGKDWVVQAICRPDGIWVERKIKTPQGLVIMRQRDIQIGDIPAAQFDVPSDYKFIAPPPPRTGKN